MSINGVFRTSVSGMNAQANRLSVVSENIANSSTNGYKRSTTEFSSLVLAQGDGEYNSGAVRTQVRQMISQQGSISASSSASDLAIQGNGFFVVADASGRDYYTRAGGFVQRSEAETGKTFLVNAAGYRLTGTSVETGKIGPIELPVGKLIPPSATTTADFSLQFPTSAAAIDTATQTPASNNAAGDVYTKKTSLVVYNQVGQERLLDVYLTKTQDAPPSANSSWDIAVYDRAQSTNGGFPYTATAPETLVKLATTVDFDFATGLPLAPLGNMPLTLADGKVVDVSFSSMTEYVTEFGARLGANGNAAGTISEFSFTSDGMLSGIMSNGTRIPLYELSLARFTSPDQLVASAGNVYSATADSGDVELGAAGRNGFGSLLSSALEQSNVDLASELTSMIESQRSYSANSKVFQTGAEILDVLVNLKR